MQDCLLLIWRQCRLFRTSAGWYDWQVLLFIWKKGTGKVWFFQSEFCCLKWFVRPFLAAPIWMIDSKCTKMCICWDIWQMQFEVYDKEEQALQRSLLFRKQFYCNFLPSFQVEPRLCLFLKRKTLFQCHFSWRGTGPNLPMRFPLGDRLHTNFRK